MKITIKLQMQQSKNKIIATSTVKAKNGSHTESSLALSSNPKSENLKALNQVMLPEEILQKIFEYNNSMVRTILPKEILRRIFEYIYFMERTIPQKENLQKILEYIYFMERIICKLNKKLIEYSIINQLSQIPSESSEKFKTELDFVSIGNVFDDITMASKSWVKKTSRKQVFVKDDKSAWTREITLFEQVQNGEETKIYILFGVKNTQTEQYCSSFTGTCIQITPPNTKKGDVKLIAKKLEDDCLIRLPIDI